LNLICDNCSTKNISKLWEIEKYIIFKCNECGLVFSNVPEEMVTNAYGSEYFKNIYPDYQSDKNIHDINNNIYLDRIEKYFKKGTILEIGSAFGFFLQAAEKRGWKAYGFEKSRYASDYAREKLNLHVFNQDFLNFDLHEDVNIVCLFDTIEHLISPSKYIEKISSILNIGDGLIITTGDLSSPFSKIFGKKWRMIAPPFHIFYYSFSSISYLQIGKAHV